MAQKVTLDLFLNDQGAIRTIAGLKEGIKLATEEANRLRDAGIGGFSELELSVGAANTRIKDFEKQLKGLTAEELGMAYARIGGGISSGFAAATAALQIFGVESDRVTQTAQDAHLPLAGGNRRARNGTEGQPRCPRRAEGARPGNDRARPRSRRPRRRAQGQRDSLRRFARWHH